MSGKALLGGAIVLALFGAFLWRRSENVRRQKRTDGQAPKKTPAPAAGVSPPSPSPPKAAAAPVTFSIALATLRSEIDAAYPSRSRVSDGGVPSAAHHLANPNSDHERGDAYDFTVDRVNGPDPDALAELARNDDRVSYVIWNERIANKSVQNNDWRPYARTAIQTDPHTSHVHVSIKHYQRDSVAPWGAADLQNKMQNVPAPSPAPMAARAPSPTMQAVPSGYVNMVQSHVTPARAAWAQALLHDQTFQMGQVRTNDIGGPIAARVEVHPADAHLNHDHRGISLYEPRIFGPPIPEPTPLEPAPTDIA
jgi:hypothetical protein